MTERSEEKGRTSRIDEWDAMEAPTPEAEARRAKLEDELVDACVRDYRTASDEAATADDLERATRSEHSWIRVEVAAHPNITPEILAELRILHPDDEALARNVGSRLKTLSAHDRLAFAAELAEAAKPGRRRDADENAAKFSLWNNG